MATPQPAVRSLLGRGSILTLATAAQMSSAILVLPFVTRLLTSAEFGQAATGVVVTQVLMHLVVLGLPSAVTLEYFDGRGGLTAARSLIVASVLVAAVMAGVIDLLGPFWADAVFSGLSYDLPLRVAVWTTVPMALVLAVQSLLPSLHRTGRFVVVTIVATAGSQLTGLALITFLRPSASVYLAGVAGGLAAAGLLGLAFTGLDASRLRDRQLLRSAFRVAIPTVPHAMAIFVVAAGDRILVERLAGINAVARYQVAYVVGAVGLTVAGALNNAWAPLIYGAGDEHRWHVLADTTAALYQLAGLLAAAVAVGCPIALLVLAPGSYQPLTLTATSAVVALSLVAYVGYLSNAHPIFQLRRVWPLAWITPLSAVLNIVLNLLLVPRLGLVGAAYATVATYGAQAWLVRRARRKLVDIPWRPTVATKAWAVAAAGVAIGAVLPTTDAWLVFRGLAAAGLLAAFATRVVRLVRPAPAPTVAIAA
ncbi:MAG: lipopolysaccharide biosynthesis protein [Acidimicrobiales bacterium]